MQETMKKMQETMNNMLKSMGGTNGVDWMKNIPSVNFMDTKKNALQILAFQHNAFESICNSIQQTQQQVEKLTEPFMKTAPGVPEEWNEMLKKNQEDFKKALEDFKKTVEENFLKAEAVFSSTCSTEETAEPAKEEPSKGKAQPKAKS